MKKSLNTLSAQDKAGKFFITKKRLLWEPNNDMCHNWYFVFNARQYDETGTHYYRYNFVLWFDVFDLMEWLDADSYTQKDAMAYADELAYNIEAPNLTDNDRREFIAWCNETIDHYNQLIA